MAFNPAPPAAAPAAPVVAPVVPTTPTAPTFETRIAEARELVAKGGSLFAPAAPVAATGAPVAAPIAAPLATDPSQQPTTTHHSQSQARSDLGQFAPEDGVDAPIEPDADASLATDAPATDDADEPADDPAMRVGLPGRGPNDADVDIVVDDPEIADRLRQLRNGYMRGEEVRAAERRLEASERALSEIEMMMRVDPEGFVFERIPQDRQASIALQMLAEPGVWAMVKDLIPDMQDDDTRDTVRVKLENERLKRRDQVGAEFERQTQQQVAMTTVKRGIAVAIPEHLPEALQVQLYHQCQQDVKDYVERTGMMIDPRDVPLLIAGRLRDAGVDPLDAASRLARQTTSDAGAGRPTNANAPRPRAAQGSQPTGEQLVRSAAVRRAASAGRPSGVMPSAAPVPAAPRGQSIQERIAWARGNMKFGASTTP